MKEVIAQGRTLEVREIAPRLVRQGGGLRGVVESFSRASRRRLIELTNRLQVEGKNAKFITLTFAGVPDDATAKQVFHRFRVSFARLYPQMSGMWRVERQRRGSIHFHIVAFSLPFVPQDDLQKLWQRCTGEQLSIVHIQSLPTHRKALNYVCKYIAKAGADAPDTSLDTGAYSNSDRNRYRGRHWGYINKKRLPLAPRQTLFVDKPDVIAKLATAIDHISGMRANTGDRGRWLLYCDDPKSIIAWLRREEPDQDALSRLSRADVTVWTMRVNAPTRDAFCLRAIARRAADVMAQGLGARSGAASPLDRGPRLLNSPAARKRRYRVDLTTWTISPVT